MMWVTVGGSEKLVMLGQKHRLRPRIAAMPASMQDATAALSAPQGDGNGGNGDGAVYPSFSPLQASQLLYDSQGSGDPRVVVTGLFDRGRRCLALNSRDAQCATGERPFFLAAIPVSPTNTAAVEKEVCLLCWQGLVGRENQQRAPHAVVKWGGQGANHSMVLDSISLKSLRAGLIGGWGWGQHLLVYIPCMHALQLVPAVPVLPMLS
jgi:hypothetical protein